MSLQQVLHLNFIGHEINDSLNDNHPVSDREVYCKKLHKITEPLENNCTRCEYFAGLMMGNGHACLWEDLQPEGLTEYVVPHRERNNEMLRVSKLIDQHTISKG